MPDAATKRRAIGQKTLESPFFWIERDIMTDGRLEETRWQMMWRVWRPRVSRLFTITILAWLVVWMWQQRATLQQIFRQLQGGQILLLLFWLTLSVGLAAWSFTLLVRGMGYSFSYGDGYHSLNLSQVAAMVPGKVWGFAGLAALLWNKGISKGDSLLIITLHTVLMLSAAAITGTVGFIALLGWQYTLLALLPIVALVVGRNGWEKLWQRFFRQTSHFPSAGRLGLILVVGCGSWAATSASFALLVHQVVGSWLVSPWLLASTFSAGYVVGYLSFITPAGLGVREGVMSLILGPVLGPEQALGLALVFRVLHMAVLWLNILITLVLVSLFHSGNPKR